MREYRSGSQILFGFLPEQTVDLRKGVWKITEWVQPERPGVDVPTLRRELRKQIAPWANAGNDGGYSQDLLRGVDVRILSLNKSMGVRVDPFPRWWQCSDCKRLRDRPTLNCVCGSPRRSQLPFVAYHDACGAMRAPLIPLCQQHRQVRLEYPGTATATDIRFECPVCGILLRKGFGFSQCECGRGRMVVNLHRAAAVFSPRTMAMINPPSIDRVRRLNEAGGAAQALTWVLSGLSADTLEGAAATVDSFRAQLSSQGLSTTLIDQLVATALASGELKQTVSASTLPEEIRNGAETEAVRIATALLESRTRLAHMIAATDMNSELGQLYRGEYRHIVERCGFEEIELVDRFPVLTGVFGYTRGGTTAGDSRLVAYRDRNSNSYVVYGEVGRTEALFFRLDPVAVSRWLRDRGHEVDIAADTSTARLNLLRQAPIDEFVAETTHPAGRDIVTLVHSYAHTLMRQIAVFAGVDRNSLSEFLVPGHLAFFIFAAAKGDFVLGGLQAVFETELHRFLETIRRMDHRCPLDPGCRRAGGACVACLHVGEPSCRLFNQFLDRRVLRSADGYFESVSSAAS
jgi:hypothetical protein